MFSTVIAPIVSLLNSLMAPLLAIQIMGLIYSKRSGAVSAAAQPLADDTVVDMEEDQNV